LVRAVREQTIDPPTHHRPHRTTRSRPHDSLSAVRLGGPARNGPHNTQRAHPAVKALADRSWPAAVPCMLLFRGDCSRFSPRPQS
jgi:hypothetical protein